MYVYTHTAGRPLALVLILPRDSGGIGRKLHSVESRTLSQVIGMAEDISESLHPDSTCVL